MFQYRASFGVVTVVLLKIWLFWDVTLHCVVSSSQCFKGAQHLHVQGQAVQELDSLTLNMKVLQPFKTPWTTHSNNVRLQNSRVFSHELRRVLAAVHFVEDYWCAGPCPVSSMPSIPQHFADCTHFCLQLKLWEGQWIQWLKLPHPLWQVSVHPQAKLCVKWKISSGYYMVCMLVLM
jgi:hypothetical protein